MYVDGQTPGVLVRCLDGHAAALVDPGQRALLDVFAAQIASALERAGASRRRFPAVAQGDGGAPPSPASFEP